MKFSTPLLQTPQSVEYSTSQQHTCRCKYNESQPLEIFSPNVNIEFTSEQNDSSVAAMESPDDKIVHLYRIILPILMLACLMSFFANLLIVCSVRWIRRKRLSPNLTLSMSLAGADAVASLVVGLGLVINSFLPVALGVPMDYHCLILSLEALRLGSLLSTAFHLLALAANHHVGISKPLHYVRIVTRKTTLASAAAIWVIPIAFFFIYFSSVPNEGFQSRGCISYDFLMYSPFRLTTAVLFFIPLGVMTVIYAHIFAIVCRHQPQNNSSSERRLKRNVKAAVTTLLILGAYVLGWMPAVLNFMLTCLDCTVPLTTIPLNVRVPVGFFTNAMMVTRCLVDPALYLIRMPEVRDALRDMLGLQTLDSSSSDPSSLINFRTDVRRFTLVTSHRKLNGYANVRNVIRFDQKEIRL